MKSVFSFLCLSRKRNKIEKKISFSVEGLGYFREIPTTGSWNNLEKERMTYYSEPKESTPDEEVNDEENEIEKRN